MDKKEQVEKELGKLHDEIRTLVEKYNRKAKTNNYNLRIAIATSSAYYDGDDENAELDDNGFPVGTDIDAYVNDNYYDYTFVDIEAPEADCWFPSSICY